VGRMSNGEVMKNLRKRQNIKVPFKQVQQVFGATFVAPEWLVLNESPVELPHGYMTFISGDDKDKGRHSHPTSFSLAQYGKYFDKNGVSVALDGMVYHYSMLTNPRNVHYAYRLFLGGKQIAYNAGLGSIQEAQQSCDNSAKEQIEKYLIDIA